MHRPVRLGGIVVVAAVVLGSCSSSPATPSSRANETATQVAAAAAQALDSASSVHVVAHNVSGGDGLSYTGCVYRNGNGALHMTSAGATFDVVVTGGTAYFKASYGLLKWLGFGGNPSKTGAIPGVGWVRMPATALDAKTILQWPGMNGGSPSTWTSPHALVSVNYHGAKAVSFRYGSEPQGVGVVYVADTGKAWPLGVVVTDANGTGTASFTGWNRCVVLSAPVHSITESAFLKRLELHPT
jgi:hypothetical protein